MQLSDQHDPPAGQGQSAQAAEGWQSNKEWLGKGLHH